MIDYRTFQLMHRHGDDWVELRPREPHDPADIDPEREWQRHGVVFQCTKCDEKVRILPVDELEQATSSR